jgi:hypothetical protein
VANQGLTGYFRRRKIQYTPVFEDANGRCQNCLHLKKDCHLFLVDSKADSSLIKGDILASSSEIGAPIVLKSSPEGCMMKANG